MNNGDFTLSSSDTSVATVDNDSVVAVGTGNATITATSDYVTVSAQIEVAEFCEGESRQCGENVF
ncbi:MAG: Ig-like domain-containing protein [Ruminococcus sp.]|nr:Ig-like domain-containing protein [Ruminococcus sp.]